MKIIFNEMKNSQCDPAALLAAKTLTCLENAPINSTYRNYLVLSIPFDKLLPMHHHHHESKSSLSNQKPEAATA
jgi:hypothetical protein